MNSGKQKKSTPFLVQIAKQPKWDTFVWSGSVKQTKHSDNCIYRGHSFTDTRDINSVAASIYTGQNAKSQMRSSARRSLRREIEKGGFLRGHFDRAI